MAEEEQIDERKLNILITRAVEEECLRQIAAVSPEIKVWDASDIATAEDRGDFSSSEKLDVLLAETEVIYGFWAPKNFVARAPKLKWIQTMLAGVEHILDTDMVESSVILTNGKGVHTTPCAEVALEMMLMFAKQAPVYFQFKQEKKWQRLPPALLRSKTLGIVGLGSIGNEIARLSKAFRMRVVAVRRSIKQVTKSRYADTVYPVEQLLEML